MKKNRRDFLKLLGLGAIAPIVPKTPINPTTPTIAGKIKTDGLIAKIENDSNVLKWTADGPERFRIYSNASMMKMYEEALWQGNPITKDNDNQNK